MNKELIKQRFSRKLNSYNENAHIQKQMAEKLINMANPISAEQVIDTKTITGSSFNELITLIILSDDQVRTVFIKQTPKRQLAFLKSARIKVKKMLPYGLSLIDGR